MNYQITPRFNQNNIIRSRSLRRRMEEEYRFPSVSIFMAFDPKMGNKNKINIERAWLFLYPRFFLK